MMTTMMMMMTNKDRGGNQFHSLCVPRQPRRDLVQRRPRRSERRRPG
jgi:hypothetical protein